MRAALTAVACAALAVLAVAGPAAAQSFGGGFDLGAATTTDGGVAGAVGGLLGLRSGGPAPPPFSGYLLARGQVAAGPRDPGSRYYTDRFSNGQARCRDSATGQFAPTEYCTPVPLYSAVFEAGVSFAAGPGRLLVGPGYAVGDAPGPVGAVTFQGGRRVGFSVRVEVGPDRQVGTVGLMGGF